MSTFHVDVSRFGGRLTGINFARDIRASRLALIRAGVTIGTQSWRRPNGDWHELATRIGITLGALQQVRRVHGTWQLRDSFQRIDASEKRIITYRLGEVFAKLATEHVLSIPWLVYVERLPPTVRVQLGPATGKQGDAVGCDRGGRWHAIEIKGRSGGGIATAIADGKEQSQNIIEVNGQVPESNSACVVSTGERPISVYLEDPNPKGMKRLRLPDKEFFRVYYSGIRGLLAASDLPPLHLNGHDFLMARIPKSGDEHFVALPIAINDDPGRAPSVCADLAPLAESRSAEGRSISLGTDGVLILGPRESVESED